MRKQITGQSLTDNLKKWINLIKHSKFTFVCLQLLVKKNLWYKFSLVPSRNEWIYVVFRGYQQEQETLVHNKSE